MNLFLEAVFTCRHGSRGKGQCRYNSFHLHWPENSKEKINFATNKNKQITTITILRTYIYTVENK